MATKNEKIALDKIARLGCILCATQLGIEGSEAEHHRNGNDSIHRLGVKRFESQWGITCEELLERQNERLGKETK